MCMYRSLQYYIINVNPPSSNCLKIFLKMQTAVRLIRVYYIIYFDGIRCYNALHIY